MARVVAVKPRGDAAADMQVMLEFLDTVTSTGAVNLNIVHPKYLDLRSLGTRTVELFMSLADHHWAAPWAASAREVYRLGVRLSKEYAKNFTAPVDPPVKHYETTAETKEYRLAYGQLYRKSKRCEILTKLLQLTSDLTPLAEGRELKHARLAAYAAPGASNTSLADVRPLQFVGDTETTLADVFSAGGADAARAWEFFREAHALGIELYDLMKQPDFDVDFISDAIRTSLARFRAKPELRGCRLGFGVIESGGDLFRKNAMKYQEEVERTDNPLDMFQLYLQDLNAHVEEVLKDPAKGRRAKLDLMRITRVVTATSRALLAQNAQGPGARLLSAVSNRLKESEKSIEEEFFEEKKSEAGEEAARRYIRDLREQLEKCEQAADVDDVQRDDFYEVSAEPRADGRATITVRRKAPLRDSRRASAAAIARADAARGASAAAASSAVASAAAAYDVDAALAYINSGSKKKSAKK